MSMQDELGSLFKGINKSNTFTQMEKVLNKVADVLQDRYADIAEDLRDTRWTWIPLMFAYKAEKQYIRMMGCLIVAALVCPQNLWNVIVNKIRR